MNKMKELSQDDFNIKLISDLGMDGIPPQRQRFAMFECPSCSKHFKARTQQIKVGTRKNFDNSCLSCANSKRATVHGDSGSALHKRWIKMIDRTTQPCYAEHYHNVSVCDEWKDYSNFKQWAESNGFLGNLSLDRIDNNGNYEPSNCRWTTKETQAQNTRVLKSNNTTGYRGVSKHRGLFAARITANKKIIYLGTFKTAIEAGKAFDKYVIENNLEHSINNIGELPEAFKGLI